MANKPIIILGSDEHEKLCLSCALISRESLIKICELDMADFYYDKNRALFLELKILYGEGKPIDSVIIRQRLREKKFEDVEKYVAEIYMTTSTTANIDYYIEQVRDYSKRRGIQAGLSKGLEYVTDRNIDVNDIIKILESNVRDVEQKQSYKPIPFSDYDFEEIMTKGESVKTGIKIFDDTVGGIFCDELTILAARPSIGKSAFAIFIALNNIELGPVIIFSLEMSRAQMGHRIVANLNMVDIYKIRMGYLNEFEIKQIKDNHTKKQYLKNLYIDYDRKHYEEIISYVRRFAIKEKPRLVLIDYLQLVKINTKENRNEQLGVISAGFKDLAKELHIPVVALSQFNRGSETTTETPDLHHLRDSGNIEQNADAVIILSGKREESERKLNMAKNRQGILTRCTVTFNAKYMIFNDYGG